MPDEIEVAGSGTDTATAEPTVVIDETPEGETPQGFVTDGLDVEEVALAKKHGLVKDEEKKDGEHDKSPKPEGKEVPKEEKVETVEVPTFEQAEADEKLVDKFGKNEKALYWKWKTDKHKRQEAQKEAEDLRGKLKEAVDSGISGKKLEKIKEMLKNPDSLTIEALTAAIDEHIEPDKKPTELDNAQVIQQKVAIKAQFAEKIGSAKYEKFNEISVLCKEVISEDKSGTFQKLIDDSFMNDSVDENMLVERVVNIARMSPKFQAVTSQVDPEAKAKADRVIENSKKKVSSASVSGASGKRIVSESELTVEQAVRLSPEAWGKLKPETKKRILMGQNP
jgi:hypothetical protein